ncbi:hypothetical protein LUZ61_019192 [Rhynchospora tenuis]|uniref:Uncharacterized protein n=1 Tax=Rhynchospora tenuis TaxID=198213 RepID=A0AAD5ZAP3_9POAL|nr:hypothetical protein LUZ61_019192 [Rhynchospora tenuis]
MTKNRGIVGLWEEREVHASSISHLTSAASFRGSEAMVRSFGIDRTLVGHRGCVDALSFNSDGYMLLSGSRDRELMLWDCSRSRRKLLCDHRYICGPVYDVKFMQDGTAITSTFDGELREIKLTRVAPARKLFSSRFGPEIHKMAFEQDNPYTFYTCSTGGNVTRFDLRDKKPVSVCVDITDSYSYLNNLSSICINPIDTNLLAVAGSSTCVLIYDVRKWGKSNLPATKGLVHLLEPNQLGNFTTHISGLAYSNTGELIASYQNENIHLFAPEQVKHKSLVNASKRPSQVVFKGHRIQNLRKDVYFLGRSCEFVACGSDTGHIYIWRKKDGTLLRSMRGDESDINCIATCPSGSVFATGGQEEEVKIWSLGSVVPNCIQKELAEAEERLNVMNVERSMSMSSNIPNRTDLDWLANDFGLNHSDPDDRSDDGSSDGRSDDGSSDASSRSDEGDSNDTSGDESDSDGTRGSDIV